VKVAKDSQGVDVISDDNRHLIFTDIVVIRVMINSDRTHFIICDFISDQCVYLFESQDSILPPLF